MAPSLRSWVSQVRILPGSPTSLGKGFLRAFSGWTPDEMYFGNGDAVVIDLAAARVRARQERMKANRMAACRDCAGDPEFSAMQLRRAESRMP